MAGEEADLSWPDEKLIIEIDGGPFHLDKGEDARKEAAWRGAGWQVERTPSDDVYDKPRAPPLASQRRSGERAPIARLTRGTSRWTFGSTR